LLFILFVHSFWFFLLFSFSFISSRSKKKKKREKKMSDERRGSARLNTTKPRSESISDVRKLDALLSTLTLENEAPQSEGNPNEVYTQEMSGVFLKRVPVIGATSDNSGTIPSYDYVVENKREYKVRIIMEFKGTNLKVDARSPNSQKGALTVEGILEKFSSSSFAHVSAADGKADFSFSAEIKVLPDQDDIRVADLEGVKLFTTVTYQDLITVMHFEAENTKEFDVEVELDLKGKLVHQSGPLPFTKLVPSGRRVALGSAQSNVEIESAWKWQQVMDTNANAEASAPGQKITQTSELKGVTLKQSMTPGDPTLIEFEVINGRSQKIAVSIDLEGEGFISFRNQPRPLVGDVFPNQTAFIGAVEIKGDATVNWKYKELTD